MSVRDIRRARTRHALVTDLFARHGCQRTTIAELGTRPFASSFASPAAVREAARAALSPWLRP